MYLVGKLEIGTAHLQVKLEHLEKGICFGKQEPFRTGTGEKIVEMGLGITGNSRICLYRFLYFIEYFSAFFDKNHINPKSPKILKSQKIQK